MLERTFSIIKPDATARHLEDEINSKIRAAGLNIIASKRVEKPTRAQFEAFYAEHKGKPFYEGLLEFMTSGPIVVQVLEGENAVAKNRELMGATNPKEAAAGTIRADFAQSIDANAVHGSDSLENAKIEIAYFFSATEICPR